MARISNTFESLAICEEAGTLEVAVEQCPSSYGSHTIPVGTDTFNADVTSTINGVGPLDSSKPDLPNVSDFSDTSPSFETFKHIKRIDELDYLSLPMSKKKLKKLWKQKHSKKSANASRAEDTISPYIMEID